MKAKIHFLTILTFILSLSIVFSSCGKKDETETATEETEEKADGITYYYTMTGEGIEGSMKIARKGEDIFWERKITAEDITMNLIVISDGKEVYVINDVNGEKTGYKSSMADYNNSIDKAEQICVINPGRTTGKFEKVGTTTVLGEDCTIYEIPDGTRFTVSDDGKTVYEVSMEGLYSVKFTNNQTVPPPSDDLFKVPTDITFEETDDILSKF